MSDIVTKDRTVRWLAADPEGFSSPINRATAHLALALLNAGHPTWRIWDAIDALNQALKS